MLESDAGILGGEPPVDLDAALVAFDLPGQHRRLQAGPVGEPLVQALSRQHAQPMRVRAHALAPDRLVSAPTDDSVNGVPCWRVTGQLDAKYLAFFTGGGVPSGTMLQTTACIGKADYLPYQLKVTGEATKGDNANTSRTFLISNYNENIRITAPQL